MTNQPDAIESAAYVAYGRGYSGATDDIEQAREWVANNTSGAVYVRADIVEQARADERARVIEECAALMDQAVGAMAKHAPAAYTVRHLAARMRALATERDEGGE